MIMNPLVDRHISIFTWIELQFGTDLRRSLQHLLSLHLRLARRLNHINFLTTCKQESLVPGFLKTTAHHLCIGPFTRTLTNNVKFKFLTAQVRDHRRIIAFLRREISVVYQHFKAVVSEMDFSLMESCIDNSFN